MPMPTNSPLIERYLPIDEISIESLREGGALAGHPPVNQLHVWWARRPLITSRAAVAASVIDASADKEAFTQALGTSSQIVRDRAAMDAMKANGEWSDVKFSGDRAFKHNPLSSHHDFFQKHSLYAGHTPTVLDVTAGGGSIPFEAGRLGLKTIANELNPVAALILHATCEWPQRYGGELRRQYGRELGIGKYDGIFGRYLKRVRELLEGVYPDVGQPKWMAEWNDKYKAGIDSGQITRAKRYDQTYLFARVISCPSCNGQIPLSPNWRLDSTGSGIRLLPDIAKRTCGFEIVSTTAEQSPGTINRAIATCPYPDCGAATPKGYIAQEAQAERLGQQLYAIIYRDQWHEFTKSGRPKKRLTTKRGFRVATPLDDNTPEVMRMLADNARRWERDNILPTEAVPEGDDRRPHTYGMEQWVKMFSPRQRLAHGLCVQAFRELVNEDKTNGGLDDVRKAAWCYIALALDKLINTNSNLCLWHSNRQVVVGTFARHDFGMKWSYAEMAVGIEGLGLEWALKDIGDCIEELVKMSGYPLAATQQNANGRMELGDSDVAPTAPPTQVITGPAQYIMEVDDGSIDCIVFDPPYHNNVNYAELSDFFYVWLKRTAGYVFPEYFTEHLADKVNEAIASPARFRVQATEAKAADRKSKLSASRLATQDYLDKMREIFDECRRVIKPAADGGIMTVMFTHKDLSAWDALITALIEAGFNITRVWPIKTEAESSMNIRDKAAARSTMLIVCRPRTQESADSPPRPWHEVETEIGSAVRADIPTLAGYNFKPVDIYNAAYGPALRVISENWGARRITPHPDRIHDEDPFRVTPTDALEVARREVTRWRAEQISDGWANSHPDPITAWYILTQDGAGATVIPFDEANLFAKAIGMNMEQSSAQRVMTKRSGRITLVSAKQRLARGDIGEDKAPETMLDRAHTAIALTERAGNSENGEQWLQWQGINKDDPSFKGTLESLLTVLKPGHDDHEWGHALYRKLYGNEHRPPTVFQPGLDLG